MWASFFQNSISNCQLHVRWSSAQRASSPTPLPDHHFLLPLLPLPSNGTNSLWHLTENSENTLVFEFPDSPIHLSEHYRETELTPSTCCGSPVTRRRGSKHFCEQNSPRTNHEACTSVGASFTQYHTGVIRLQGYLPQFLKNRDPVWLISDHP